MSAAEVLLVVAAVLLWPGASVLRSGQAARRPQARDAGRWRRRGGPASEERLADLAETVAMALRAGATPPRAVELARADAGAPWDDVLTDVAAALARGEEAGPVWSEAAQQHPEVGFLGGAWQLSERLGSPLAPTVEVAAEVLRGRLAVRRRLDAASAGPRATMVMLTLLPLVGLLAGLTFGIAPWTVVTWSTATMLSVGVGVVLTGLGWMVCRVVLRRAVREQVHR